MCLNGFSIQLVYGKFLRREVIYPNAFKMIILSSEYFFFGIAYVIVWLLFFFAMQYNVYDLE